MNGVLVGTNTNAPASIVNPNVSFFLGSRNGSSRQADADFQELAIFQDVLSQSQILAHFNAAFQFPPPPVPLAPEPGSLLLFSLILAALAWFYWRGRRLACR